MDNLSQTLTKSLQANFQLEPIRPNFYQIYLPAYYPDGDMMDIFIQQQSEDSFCVCDCSATLMRLSYSYELNSDRKRKILKNILHENGADIEDGNIFITASLQNLPRVIMQFVQILSQIAGMKQFQHTIEQTMFYENMRNLIDSEYQSLSPRRDVTPLPGNDEYVVDYVLAPQRKCPIFLFPVSGQSRTQTVVITLLKLQQSEISFTGVVVHNDFEKLSGRTQKFITNAADKQFVDFKSFADNGNAYIRRLLAV